MEERNRRRFTHEPLGITGLIKEDLGAKMKKGRH